MPRAVLALVLGALLTVVPALPGPASAVAVSQSYPMPAKGSITIKGHGFGHGHGMSQYGAEGAARAGKTWRQILQFYYPGTAWGTGPGRVKVLVSADTTRDVVVAPRTGLRVRDMATGEVGTLAKNGATRWRLAVATNGRSVVDYRTDRWRRWKVLTGDGAFYAGGSPITLYYGSTSRQYRGYLIGARPAKGSSDLDTVNWIRVENYLRGVVPLEMPASWKPDAVRAQAVAARTYAAYEMRHPRAAHYQICDTTSCQVYGGYTAEHDLSDAAITATKGVILTWKGTPAFSQFGSSSGGWTSANQFPYLPAQQDPYDDWPGNPVHSWSVRMDVAKIERTWPGVGNLTKIQVTERDGNGEWRGRIWKMRLVGTKNGSATSVAVSGDTFRSRLGLRSTWITFVA
ncbi:SpoIID/LytB domain-containing protein [Nocardioides guangzhouensis]|uniref:SpoIID/LytB domain-containing protein n=1 Tax=Nocardioides guangzhouensis TaxID=2497878 RepID=A0A4Q4ZFV7_9ACTN|nr:SpoIID/LytB domain-containing protein [Nocardioides guangzhouensis]RYP86306.1 SpoIID/LytB domain-containing protein [Nocardioides guangzhouensis]